MSIRIMSLIWSEHNGFLTSSEKALLLRLADFAADDGTSIYPGLSRLERDTCFARSSIKRIIKSLLFKNVLVEVQKCCPGTHRTNVYRININVLESMRDHENIVLEEESFCDDSVTMNPGGGSRMATGVTMNPGGGVTMNPGGGVTMNPNPPLKPVIKIHQRSYIVELDKNDVKTSFRESPVRQIFDHWKAIMNHPKSTLDPKRKNIIAGALKRFSVDDLKQAIEGCSKTPHNMGDNERGERYDGLHVILRDAEQIERFIRNSIKPPLKVSSCTKKERIRQAEMDADRDVMLELEEEIRSKGGMDALLRQAPGDTEDPF